MAFDLLLTNIVLPQNGSVLEGYDPIWTRVQVHLTQVKLD